MSELPKQYQPADHEQRIYQLWEENNAFAPAAATPDDKPPYSIVLPPPNITGRLHMGHALNGTIQDILIRYHRMQGHPTVWIPGTDHAGIATQNVVEKQLIKEGTDRRQLGRAKFIARVWQWQEEYGHAIIDQLKKLGSSCDWSRTTFTMDENYIKAVQHAFIAYYNRGCIYRGQRLVNWCSRCASVISDLEVVHQDQMGTLTTIKYPLKDSHEFISVATTRPETMLGDTAVAVHPEDKRYQKLVGKTVILPLAHRRIPIIADHRIDQEFGTGAVKITPAHDPLDAAIGETHQLPAIKIIGEDGLITNQAQEFSGLTIEEARLKVIAALRAKDLIVDQQDHQHSVAVCYRCGTTVEPLISRQWFVAMDKLKDVALEAAQKDALTFSPPRWKDHYVNWLTNVHDWTISRQLWWGHRLPVWWKKGTRGTEQEPGSFKVGLESPGKNWEQDPDVLDTWFSSALWPLVTLGWPDNNPDLQRFYPTSVLSTARDILYLWVVRMVFSGLELTRGESYDNRDFNQRLPFKQVLIHPTVLNHQGKRMSKSLGTGVDPLELIAEYGADATRFGLMYQMNHDSQAIKFDRPAIKNARNFANKIWNMARFLDGLPDQENPSPADQWIKSRSAKVTGQVTSLIQRHQLGEAARTLYDFVWQDYADWYIEILKTEGSTKVARQIFKNILTLLHPFMPHLTETLWQHYNYEGLLITAAWPSPADQPDDEIERQMISDQSIIETVRSARALLELPPGLKIKLHAPAAVISNAALSRLTNTEPANRPTKKMKPFPRPDGQPVYLELPAEAVDHLERAKSKLRVELAKLTDLLTSQKLIVENMKGKAPAAKIIAKERLIANTTQKIAELNHSLLLLE